MDLTEKRIHSERVLDGLIIRVDRDTVTLPDGSTSLREIANSLFISHNTIKTHTRSLYRKLGVNSRHDAIETARTMNLL